MLDITFSARTRFCRASNSGESFKRSMMVQLTIIWDGNNGCEAFDEVAVVDVVVNENQQDGLGVANQPGTDISHIVY